MDGNWINAINVVSSPSTSMVVMFPLRESYFPPCFATMS